MSDFLPPVIAVLGAEVSGFSTGIGEAIKEMGRAETSFGKLSALGKAAFLGLGAAAVGIGAESVKLAASFDQAMEMIHTQAGASQQEVDALKQKVLDLAPAVGIGPEKLAEGLYHVESAGFRGAQAMDIVSAAAKGAAIGGANLEDVTQAMIGVMASGVSGVKDANDAMAILNQTVGIGDMRMEGLAKAIGTGILPTAKNFGLSMQDVSAALATVTDNATPPDEAATRLRMTFSLLAVQTPTAAKALSSIGITSGELGADLRKPNGLMVAVMDLKTHLEKSGKTAVEQGQIISKAFGGGKSAGTIETLLGESDRLKSKYEELGTAGSRAAKFQDAWASQQKQFSQEVKKLGAELQALGVKFGNFLIPKIQSSIDWMSKHKEIVKVVAAAIGGVLVVAIGAYTIAMAQAAIATIAATWEILLIIAVVALVAVGIYELVKHWKTVWNWIKRIAADVWHWLVDAWHDTWNAILAAVDWIKKHIIDPIVDFFDKYLVKPAVETFHFLSDEWHKVWDGIKGAIDSAWRFMKPIFDKISDAIHAVTGGLSAIAKAPGEAGSALAHLIGFADGGWVPGAPGEAQLAVVHGGEFVLSRDMLASMRGSGPTVSGTVPLPGMAAGLGAQTITVQNNLTLMVDGKHLHAALIPAAQQYKARTGTTGLA